MKRVALVLVVVIVVSVLGVALIGCKPISTQNAFALLKEAYENSKKEEIFSWKETAYDTKVFNIRHTNVLCDLDKNYNKAKDENGNYAGLKVYTLEKTERVNPKAEAGVLSQVEQYIGLSKTSKNDKGKNLKFVKDQNATLKNTYSEASPYDFLKTEEFRARNLTSMLTLLDGLLYGDVEFVTKGEQAPTKNSKLVTMSFKLSEEYKKNYRQANDGKASLLEGSVVNLQIAYSRIVSIIVLEDENLGGSIFTSQYEKYKLEIVYYGQKITIPNWQEVDSNKNPVWIAV